MRNFRFDTGFITGLQPNRKLLIKSSLWEIGSCLATFAHAQMNLYTSSAESLSLLRAVPRRNTRGLCSQGTVNMAYVPKPESGTKVLKMTPP